MRSPTWLILATLLCAQPAAAQIKPMPRFAEGATAKLVVPFGNTLHVDRIGATIFDNKHAEYDISAWKLAEGLEISLAKIFNNYGAIKVEPMGDAQARVALDAANKSSKLRLAIKEYGAKSNADVLVVVNGFRPTNEPYFGTGVSLHKFGIAEAAIGRSRTAIYYAMLTVVFFDAHTGKQLAYGNYDARNDRSPLPDDLSQSAADLESARRAIVHLIEYGVARTVKDMIDLRPDGRK